MKLPMLFEAANQNAAPVQCVPLRAKLSTSSCGKRWRLSQADTSGQYAICQRCEVGGQRAAVAS